MPRDDEADVGIDADAAEHDASADAAAAVRPAPPPRRRLGLTPRILIAVVLFVAALQVASYALVSRATEEAARSRTGQELVLGEHALTHALDGLRQQLRSSARLLATDPTLREVAAGSGGADLFAARVELGPADRAQLLDAGGVRASVSNGKATARAAAAAEAPLLDAALRAAVERQGIAAGVIDVDGTIYEVAASVVAGVDRPAILVLAIAYDDALALELRRLTTVPLRFDLVAADGSLRPLGAAAPAPTGTAAGAGADVERTAAAREVQRKLVVAELATTAEATGGRVQATLQRSSSDVLPVFERLQMLMLMIGAGAVALAVGASLLIAHAVRRPLRQLTAAAQRIRDGDYRAPIQVRSADEIGLLADSLNHMRLSIAARDERNQQLAYSDTLTGLPNRTRLIGSIRMAIERARQEQGIKPHSWIPEPGHGRAAVMLLDLDRFKQINDTLGHRVGDAVLSLVSKRINQAVRPADIVARLGGDEFAVALPRADASVAKQVARDITHALKKPIENDELNRELTQLQEAPIEYDSSIDIGASIGIAVYPEDGGDDQTLLRRADIAMYAAKRAHAAWAVFDTRHEVARLEHLSLLSELRRAVEESQLRAYYQPKLDLATNRVIGAEALVRWRHPDRGLLSPAEFMPYAEQTGYIRVVTRWMLAVVLRQCGAWAAAGTPLQVAVNLSARDLERQDLVRAVEDLLRTHNVPPHLVCLEITESTFMQDPDRALELLDKLNALGVRLSIDDFGTGFSSLGYMKRLPVHELKIDATFVQGMATSEKDVSIVRSTIQLAHNLGLKVVAEGVEDERCLERLRALGCDEAQGYLLGRPMRRSAFETFLRTRADGAKPSRRQAKSEEAQAAG